MKKRLFNFKGEISKILFGILVDDPNYYTDKMFNLKNEQLYLLKLSKEQITVVKTTYRSINFTLLTVTDNENSLSKGMEEMAKQVNEHDGKVDMFTAYSLLLLNFNEHAMQINRVIVECRREYEILIY